MEYSHKVDKKLNGRRNGFFVECGAADGHSYSHTLFLEMERNWTGLLVEANQRYLRSILSLNRQVGVYIIFCTYKYWRWLGEWLKNISYPRYTHHAIITYMYRYSVMSSTLSVHSANYVDQLDPLIGQNHAFTRCNRRCWRQFDYEQFEEYLRQPSLSSMSTDNVDQLFESCVKSQRKLYGWLSRFHYVRQRPIRTLL